jgi:VanZ family protein
VWCGFAVAAAGVLYFTLKPGPGGGPFQWWDKAQHFSAYLTLAFLAGLAAKDWRQAALFAVGLAVAGYALEIVQSYVGRSYDLFDEAANALGCAAGFAASRLARGIAGRA